MRKFWTGGIVLILLLVAACDVTKIGEIKSQSKRHMHKECIVEGYVTERWDIPFKDERYFKINDGTGDIWVATEKGVPPKSKKVRVKGTVHKGTFLGLYLELDCLDYLD
jgi:hypothetical protein